MISERPHLMLVEQDELLAEITAFRLELLGYQVTCLDTRADLLRQLQQVRPDLILLGMTLSDVAGIELMNRLRSDSHTSTLPVLVLSMEADLDVVEAAFAAGANDYLVIPFDPSVLEDKIETLLTAAKVR